MQASICLFCSLKSRIQNSISFLPMQSQQLGMQFKKCAKNTSFKIMFPNQKNFKIWHITFTGASDTFFDGGLYHIELDLTNYPDKAPDIIFLHENGSFIPNHKICINGITSFHGESWTPETQIESIIQAVKTYMSIDNKEMRNGIGFIQQLDEKTIKGLIQKTKVFKCSQCKCDHSQLKLTSQ